MDLTNKKTALDDSADIYQEREEKTQRERWKDLASDVHPRHLHVSQTSHHKVVDEGNHVLNQKLPHYRQCNQQGPLVEMGRTEQGFSLLQTKLRTHAHKKITLQGNSQAPLYCKQT